MVNYVNPIVLYQGKLSQIKEADNIGSGYFTTYNYNYSNNNTILKPFTQVFANNQLVSTTFKLEDQNLQQGDLIRIIDIKNTFFNYPLEINPQSQKLDGDTTSKYFETPSVILDFIVT